MTVNSNDDFVRIPDGLEEGAVLCYNITDNTFVDSGVKAKNGSIDIDSGILELGPHQIASTGENVVFKNNVSNRIFFPPWKEIDPTGALERDLTTRSFTSELQEVEIGTELNSVVVNPDFTLDITNPTTVFQFDAIFVQAYTDVILEIFYEPGNTPFWKGILPFVDAGLQRIQLPYPVDTLPGTIRLRISLVGGQAIELRGNTTGEPYLDFYFRTFEETPVATQRYVTENAAQADWDETNTESPAYILNKPDISDVVQIAEGAHVRYVSNNGNDSNSGLTPTSPLASLNKAVADAGNDGWAVCLDASVFDSSTSIILNANHNIFAPMATIQQDLSGPVSGRVRVIAHRYVGDLGIGTNDVFVFDRMSSSIFVQAVAYDNPVLRVGSWEHGGVSYSTDATGTFRFEVAHSAVDLSNILQNPSALALQGWYVNRFLGTLIDTDAEPDLENTVVLTANGDDDHNGLSFAQPVATLARAAQIARGLTPSPRTIVTYDTGNIGAVDTSSGALALSEAHIEAPFARTGAVKLFGNDTSLKAHSIEGTIELAHSSRVEAVEWIDSTDDTLITFTNEVHFGTTIKLDSIGANNLVDFSGAGAGSLIHVEIAHPSGGDGVATDAIATIPNDVTVTGFIGSHVFGVDAPEVSNEPSLTNAIILTQTGDDANTGESDTEAVSTLAKAYELARAKPSSAHKAILSNDARTLGDINNSTTGGNVSNLLLSLPFATVGSVGLADHATTLECRHVHGNVVLGDQTSLKTGVIGATTVGTITFSPELISSSILQATLVEPEVSLSFAGVLTGSHIHVEIAQYGGDIDAVIATVPNGVKVTGFIDEEVLGISQDTTTALKYEDAHAINNEVIVGTGADNEVKGSGLTLVSEGGEFKVPRGRVQGQIDTPTEEISISGNINLNGLNSRNTYEGKIMVYNVGTSGVVDLPTWSNEEIGQQVGDVYAIAVRGTGQIIVRTQTSEDYLEIPGTESITVSQGGFLVVARSASAGKWAVGEDIIFNPVIRGSCKPPLEYQVARVVNGEASDTTEVGLPASYYQSFDVVEVDQTDTTRFQFPSGVVSQVLSSTEGKLMEFGFLDVFVAGTHNIGSAVYWSRTARTTTTGDSTHWTTTQANATLPRVIGHLRGAGFATNTQKVLFDFRGHN